MFSSSCICQNLQSSEFKKIIEYKNEKIFKDYEGVIIAKCLRCGVLKTLNFNKKFNPEQSRVNFYEENRYLFLRLFKPVIEKIKIFKKKGKVLEVGCSSGILLQLLKENNFDIYGIEPNKKAFTLAQKKFGKRIFNGRLWDFVSKNKSQFDVVIYNHVLEHIQNPVEELKLVPKVLNRGGIFVIGVPNIQNVIFFLRGKYWEFLMPNEHIWHFSKSYLPNLLKKQGFKVLDLSFSNDERRNYPFLKRLYFRLLSLLNNLSNRGEAMLLITIFDSQPSLEND